MVSNKSGLSAFLSLVQSFIDCRAQTVFCKITPDRATKILLDFFFVFFEGFSAIRARSYNIIEKKFHRIPTKGTRLFGYGLSDFFSGQFLPWASIEHLNPYSRISSAMANLSPIGGCE